MIQSPSVVIVGAGVMGASVAYHLAARGVTNVLVLERAPQPVMGSTARSAAGVRHQFSTRTNVKLSQWSIERLKHFRDEIGSDADLQQIGYLLLHSRAASWSQALRDVTMQRELGVRVELLTPEQAARSIPHLKTDGLQGATFGPDDGFCNPRNVAQGYLDRAQQLGVRVQCDTTVTAIERHAGQISGVHTSQGQIACDMLVNAAGAWAGSVAALAAIDLPVEPQRRSIYVSTDLPQFNGPIPLTIDVASGFWMRKNGAALLMGMARADQSSSFTTDVDWDWWPKVHAAGTARLPVLQDAVIDRARSWAGLYEVTPDGNPVLGRHPTVTNYVDISGFSGHGIMHAPAAGMLIAEEIVDGRAHTIEIDDLRIDRFTGVLQREQHVF